MVQRDHNNHNNESVKKLPKSKLITFERFSEMNRKSSWVPVNATIEEQQQQAESGPSSLLARFGSVRKSSRQLMKQQANIIAKESIQTNSISFNSNHLNHPSTSFNQHQPQQTTYLNHNNQTTSGDGNQLQQQQQSTSLKTCTSNSLIETSPLIKPSKLNKHNNFITSIKSPLITTSSSSSSSSSASSTSSSSHANTSQTACSMSQHSIDNPPPPPSPLPAADNDETDFILPPPISLPQSIPFLDQRCDEIKSISSNLQLLPPYTNPKLPHHQSLSVRLNSYPSNISSLNNNNNNSKHSGSCNKLKQTTKSTSEDCLKLSKTTYFLIGIIVALLIIVISLVISDQVYLHKLSSVKSFNNNQQQHINQATTGSNGLMTSSSDVRYSSRDFPPAPTNHDDEHEQLGDIHHGDHDPHYDYPPNTRTAPSGDYYSHSNQIPDGGRSRHSPAKTANSYGSSSTSSNGGRDKDFRFQSPSNDDLNEHANQRNNFNNRWRDSGENGAQLDNSPVCMSAGCVRAAAQILNNIDNRTDPCDNFYQFACGRWIETQIIPDEKTSLSVFSQNTADLNIQLRALVEAKPVTSDPPIVGQMRNLYWSCMNLTEIESRGDEPLLEVLRDLGGWPVLNQRVLGSSLSSFSDNQADASTTTTSGSSTISQAPVPQTTTTSATSPFSSSTPTSTTSSGTTPITSGPITTTTQSILQRRSITPGSSSPNLVQTTPIRTTPMPRTTQPIFVNQPGTTGNNLQPARLATNLAVPHNLAANIVHRRSRPTRQTGANSAWLDTLIKFRRRGFSHDMIIDLSVVVDIRNNRRYIVDLDQSSLGMPDRSYYFKGTNDTTVRAYMKLMVDAAVMLGAPPSEAQVQMREAFDFETNLAKMSIGREQRRNVSRMYNKMVAKELYKLAPNIDWRRYLTTLLDEPEFDIETEEVVVKVPSFLRQLDDLLVRTDPRIVRNYLIWRIVRHSMLGLSRKWRELAHGYNSITTGRQIEEPRWEVCLSSLEGTLASALSAMYIKNHFNQASKQAAMQMVEYIRNEFKRILQEVDWMDEETRREAIEKADAISEYIGYPDELLQDDLVEELYSGLSMGRSNYYQNLRQLRIWGTNYAFSQLRKPNKRGDWKKHARAAVVNAFYNSLENSIEFPAGILRGAFFDAERPNYMNFGAIGYVIGHEITHGFDDRGRQYDKDGQERFWWKPKTDARFRERAQCIIEQYGNYTVKETGLKVNGLNTQGENIADNGGIKEAFHAYQHWTRDHGREARLPGLSYSPNQLFWISAANIWCGKFRPEVLKLRVNSGVHSPSAFRIIGPLSNSPEFAKSFNCPEGSPMNPRKKCSVW